LPGGYSGHTALDHKAPAVDIGFAALRMDSFHAYLVDSRSLGLEACLGLDTVPAGRAENRLELEDRIGWAAGCIDRDIEERVAPHRSLAHRSLVHCSLAEEDSSRLGAVVDSWGREEHHRKREQAIRNRQMGPGSRTAGARTAAVDIDRMGRTL